MKPSTAVKAGAAAAVAGAVAALLWVLPHFAAWFGEVQTGLKSHRTKHFIVYSTNPAVAEKAGQDAEEFAAAFVAEWGTRHAFALPDPPVPIYLFDDHAALQKYGLFKTRNPLENNGGYFSPTERVLALVRTQPGALRHELTHMMVDLSWPEAHVSPWFGEGHAQWHEAGAKGGPPQEMMAICKQVLAGGRSLSLDELLSLPETAFTVQGNLVPYSESAALFAWLAIRKPDALDRIFEQERLGDMRSSSDFAKAVGEPLDDAEREWQAWVRAQ